MYHAISTEEHASPLCRPTIPKQIVMEPVMDLEQSATPITTTRSQTWRIGNGAERISSERPEDGATACLASFATTVGRFLRLSEPA